jgi:hypothetical protein
VPPAACARPLVGGSPRLASISGHTTLREIDRYMKAADQERIVRIGMAAIANIGRTKTGNRE